MTDKRTDQLPTAAALTGDEILAIDQAGNSRRTTTGDIATIPHDHAIDDVAGLSAALAGKANVGDVVNPIGLKQLSIPAGAMKIRTTNGAAAGSVETATNKHMIDSLDFDQTTQEHAQFTLVLPQSWNAGTLAFAFIWTTTGTTGCPSSEHLAQLAA